MKKESPFFAKNLENVELKNHKTMTTPKTEPDLKTVLKTESICLSEEEKLELELDFCLAELEEFLWQISKKKQKRRKPLQFK